MTHFKSLLAAVALSALLPACSEYAAICQKEATCVGGNDKDVAACAEVAEGYENEADAYGCLDKFDALTTCEGTATCMSGHFSVDCSSQSKALRDCITSASGKK